MAYFGNLFGNTGKPDPSFNMANREAIDILDSRLAKGELTSEEYDALKQRIESGHSEPEETKAPGSGRQWSAAKRVLNWMFWIAVFIAGVMAYSNYNFPNCEVSNLRMQGNMFTTDEGPDWGITAIADVANRGADGTVKLSFKLIAPSGTFRKTHEEFLKRDEEKTVKVTFLEPLASDALEQTQIKGHVECAD